MKAKLQEENVEHSCPECDKELETERGLKSHYGQVHEGTLKNTETCSRCGDEFEVWPSQSERRVQCGECYDEHGMHPESRQKSSDTQAGKEIEWNDKISDSMSKGEDHRLHGVTGDSHPASGSHITEEGRKSLSKAHLGHEPYGPVWETVEKTGHTVRSSWEKEIDLLLHESGISYEYEPRRLELDSGSSYLPDFIVRNEIVIEVKGYADDESIQKFNDVVEQFDYDFVVVGDSMNAGTHIEWEQRESLLAALNRGEGQSSA